MQLPSPAAAVPATRVAFLFPGQGSQAIGMLASCKDLPPVRAMLATAQRVLGYDLLAVCTDGAPRRAMRRSLSHRCPSPARTMLTPHATPRAPAGPKSKLDDTVYAQPALFVAGLAAVEKLRAENPGAADSASCCAGLSLGEYTALVFAGALSFEDGLKVVKTRAESMAAAAAVGAHGMLSVVGMGDAELDAICVAAAAKAGPGCVARLRAAACLHACMPAACVCAGCHGGGRAEVLTRMSRVPLRFALPQLGVPRGQLPVPSGPRGVRRQDGAGGGAPALRLRCAAAGAQF